MSGYRYRIRFRKLADLRLIGHHDLARLWERVFRRADVPLAMSEGYHPKARLSFPLALPLGVAGYDEILEIQLTQSLDSSLLVARLVSQLPPGLEIVSLEELPPGARKAQVVRVAYQVDVPAERHAVVAERVARLQAAAAWPYRRPEDGREVDVRPDIEHVVFCQGRLQFTLRHHHHAGARPRDILDIVGLADLSPLSLGLARTRVELADTLPVQHTVPQPH